MSRYRISTRNYIPTTRSGGEGLSVRERAAHVAANGDTSIRYNSKTYSKDFMEWTGVSGKPTRKPIRINHQTLDNKTD